MKNKIVQTQVRLPENIHGYIKEKADQMGIPMNSFLVILLEQGKVLWESEVIRKIQ